MESYCFGDEFLFIGLSFLKRVEKIDFLIDKLKDEKVIYIFMGMVLDEIEEFFNLCIDVFFDVKGKVVIVVGEKVDLIKLK